MHHWLRRDGRPCYPTILPHICPPKPVPIPHAFYTPSHSPSLHPLIPPDSPTLPSPAPRRASSATPPLCHPLPTSFLPPSSYLSILSPSPTRPHLSLSLPRSNLILLLLCFPHV